MRSYLLDFGSPPPPPDDREPERRRKPEPEPDLREIMIYQDGAGWCLLEISPNGSGGLQIACGTKRECIAAAVEWAEMEPIKLTIGTALCFPGESR
jgi:hypothetical protein